MHFARTLTTAALALMIPSAAMAASESLLYSWRYYRNEPMQPIPQGLQPNSGVVQNASGHLFGITTLGGQDLCDNRDNGCGIVFELTPRQDGTYGLAVIHSFTGGTDGSLPDGPLSLDPSGAIYGTTQTGGAGCPALYSSGCGTVFKLTPPAKGQTVWTETIVHRFAGGSDGQLPNGGVVEDARGTLFAATVYGGTGTCNDGYRQGCGTVVKLTPPAPGTSAWTEAVLSFQGGTDGSYPDTPLNIDANDDLYGATQGGTTFNGVAGGSVFQIAPFGTALRKFVLHRFNQKLEGGPPYGVTFDPASGLVYGTLAPPYPNKANGSGEIFRLTPPARVPASNWTVSLLYTFQDTATDGNTPLSLVPGPGGSLFGTTEQGGGYSCSGFTLYGCGTIFKLTPPADTTGSWTRSTLHAFTGKPDAAVPSGPIFLDATGAIIGTTMYGGPGGGNTYPGRYGLGTVFKVTP